MQDALCTADNRHWTAEAFSQLPDEELQNLRTMLLCPQCKGPAWYRRESVHGHPAHFCAHHEEDCELKVHYRTIVDPRDDVTGETEEIQPGGGIYINLDDERPDGIATEVPPPPNGSGGSGGRTHAIAGENYSASQYTLKRLLYRLARSPDFQKSRSQITVHRDGETWIQGPINEVIIPLERAGDKQDERMVFFWGQIASVGMTADGRLWLNSQRSRSNDASIAIFDNIREDFINQFKIEDIEEICGAHVLISGRRIHRAPTGKLIIWCPSVRNIMLRRYREQ